MTKFMLVLFAICALPAIVAAVHLAGNPFQVNGSVYFDATMRKKPQSILLVGVDSVVLETSSSFESTLCGLSMSNSPSGGIVRSDDNGGLNLLDKSVRDPCHVLYFFANT